MLQHQGQRDEQPHQRDQRREIRLAQQILGCKHGHIWVGASEGGNCK
jgi:hypothetical protein